MLVFTFIDIFLDVKEVALDLKKITSFLNQCIKAPTPVNIGYAVRESPTSSPGRNEPAGDCKSSVGKSEDFVSIRWCQFFTTTVSQKKCHMYNWIKHF